MKKISIIIPCRNEEKYISTCLTSLIEMDYPKNLMEIIVVDGRSQDRTLEIVHKYQLEYPFVRVIDNPKLFTPQAFNLGIKNASYELVMISSAHSSFDKNYVSEVLNALEILNCDGAGGVITTKVRSNSRKALSICEVLSNHFGVGNSKFRVGTDKPIEVDIVPFGIYKKSLIEVVGYYDERLIRNQDMELSKRIIENGKKIYLIPTAKSIYFARETYKELFANNFANGLWIPITVYITKKFSSLSLRHFVPLIFLLSLILPTVMMLVEPLAGIAALSSLSAYLILLALVSFKINNQRTSFFHIMYAFLVLHISYGIGSLLGLIRFDFLKKYLLNE